MTQAHARIWADDLADVDYDEAVEAVREHFRTSDRWLMPAHVLHGVLTARKARNDQLYRERVSRALRPAPVTFERQSYDAAVAWFTAHPDSSVDEWLRLQGNENDEKD